MSNVTMKTLQGFSLVLLEKGGAALISEAIAQYEAQKGEHGHRRNFSDLGGDAVLQEALKKMKTRRMSTPHPIKMRLERIPLNRQQHRKKPGTLQRSKSTPECLSTLGTHQRTPCKSMPATSDQAGDLELPNHPLPVSDDEDVISEVSEEETCNSFRGGSARSSQSSLNKLAFEDDTLTYAEALWDHVTMDPEELAFRAGDLIEVTDMADKDWWWGVMEDYEGWFPAAFVRLRANQEDTAEDFVQRLKEGDPVSGSAMRRYSISFVSKDQARTNVVNEIIGAEREYVKHLQDVVEGYILNTRKRPEMFSEDRITTIFGNMEELFALAVRFLEDLEKCYNAEEPHKTEFGQCFVNHSKEFKIYSEYCNNHPLALEELKRLQLSKKYMHFFEACRLLRSMISIPLVGFLLTPVQKICKYHLQLQELLKYTAPAHMDHAPVRAAMEEMKDIAMFINERKRRMESIEKIALWQKSVEDWEGEDLLERSSELILSGDLNKVNSSGWSQERTFFLFDRQMIYCKKDILKRDSFSFKGRIDLDICHVIPIEDGRDVQFNSTVKNAWKMHEEGKDKWYLLYAKTPEEKQRWLQSFETERKHVIDDAENNFTIPPKIKQAAMSTTKQSKVKSYPEKPIKVSKSMARKISNTMPAGHQPTIMRDVPTSITLPRGVSSHDMYRESKKRTWFPFGSRKSKR